VGGGQAVKHAGGFIVLEGGEGSGKTTQARLLAERLRAAGAKVTSVREPGGTSVGDRIREILLDPVHEGLDSRAELMLYEASRAEHVARVIRPRLEAGDYVVCDRFSDSSLAYQGYGRGLDLDAIRTLDRLATGGLVADLTVYIDLDARTGVARATGGGEADRLEAEDLAFHERVRSGFLEISRSPRHVVVDGSRTVAEVAGEIWAAVVAADPRLAGR
jgi:dTMP kinase